MQQQNTPSLMPTSKNSSYKDELSAVADFLQGCGLEGLKVKTPDES